MKISGVFRLLLVVTAAVPLSLAAQDSSGPDDPYTSATFRGLTIREIGPALMSGRIADFAVNPEDPAEYYVATAAGGLWKTVNAGTTYEPIFKGEGSYSTGVVTLDPNNPHVVWLGTGENNGQRSVSYGDGVYRSEDGGGSWTHMGLRDSEHIGAIIIDPRDSNRIFVAAQGPLWSAGGERGLYRSTNGGNTWDKVLEISEHTGVNEVVMDPRNPDVMYATAWQRRRHVWTFISGGPESAFYKSADGGDSWTEVTAGFPKVDLGRIGICVSPVNPDYVYAIVEAQDGEGGFFRSTNRGASFSKRSSYSTSGNYYQEIICDPFDRDRVYSMNTWAMVTDDGGASFHRLGEHHKHVDNHAFWVDATDPDHYLIGTDGGIYESWDRGRYWDFKANLPVTQFYKVATDNALPFYGVYGGTQDNFSLGGPSGTISNHGIVNSDWVVTNGGDGFETQVDQSNANIVYAQSQYGGLVRYDQASGEGISIQPLPDPDEPALRWNWDAPLFISPHSNTRLYFAAQQVFRTDDRGDSWRSVSGDLSRQLDRNQLPVMDQVWGMDAVAKNASTTIYGNIVAFDESPVQEDLLWAGTDDGLVHVTENGGMNWRRLDDFPGVPERTYVNMLLTSRHDARTVFAAFNNHKNGDFAPYLLRSDDLGDSWTSIASDLPERGSVYAIAQDHIDANLLFVGTEFGVYFSRDGGDHWVELAGGLPTIAVRDLAIQVRENDLVLATFGRGFWVLDDYTSLRSAAPEVMASDAHIFPVKTAKLYVQSYPLGLRDKSMQGESYYTADNPPFGATFTYYLKDDIQTRSEQRKAAEAEAREAGDPIGYPSFADMRAEDQEQDPYLLFTVTDMTGNVVRRLRKDPGTGIQRITWDLRYPPSTPIDLGPPPPENPFSSPPIGPLVSPGTYRVAMSAVVDGVPKQLVGPTDFQVESLNNATLAAADRDALLAFQQEAGAVRREIQAASGQMGEMADRLRHVQEAIRQAPQVPESELANVRALDRRLAELRRSLQGDQSVARRQFETAPSISQRIGRVVGSSYTATAAPSPSQRAQVRFAAEAFAEVRTDLAALQGDLRALEDRLEQMGAPFTQGRRGGN